MDVGTSALTGFHVTHWKAGSQWIRAIIHRLDSSRLVVGPGIAYLEGYGGTSGALYSPVYLHREAFYRIAGHDPSHRRVVVVRDLRDAAVSWYFSVLHSHPSNQKVLEFREQLATLSLADGLLLAFERPVAVMAKTQSSWREAPDDERLMIRYEDLISDSALWMNRLLDHLGVNADPLARAAALQAESFENRTGRKLGEEDVSRHERKGVAGDWQNHFTDRVKDAFKEKFGQVLIETGYEADLNW